VAFEIVQIAANGVLYEGWESCQITAALDLSYAFAQLTITELGGTKDTFNPDFEQWNFPPGTPVQIIASGNPIFSGIVNLYAPAVDETQHTVTILVKTIGVDISDSAPNQVPSNFEDQPDLSIVQQLAASVGVPIKNYTSPDIIPYWQLKQGATIYQESMRILQQRGKMLWSSLNGDVNITKDRSFGLVTDGALIQGENLEKLSARLSNDGWNLVEVIGQAPRGVDPKLVMAPYGIAFGPTTFIPGAGLSSPAYRQRYKRIIDQAATTQQLAQIRAEWEMNRSLGQNLQVQVTVPGWRTRITEGTFWQVNTDVYVYAPYLKVDCILRIWKTVFNQDSSGGTTTTILLVDGAATGDSASACNSGSIWQYNFVGPRG
jgi:prophage tail gpP-like protein